MSPYVLVKTLVFHHHFGKGFKTSTHGFYKKMNIPSILYYPILIFLKFSLHLLISERKNSVVTVTTVKFCSIL